ncbi:MAG: hypothetical protein KGH93_03600 [Patescibacteria group bacterium]|nr:hypothetical protein [Patescibacteria group bacterium]
MKTPYPGVVSWRGKKLDDMSPEEWEEAFEAVRKHLGFSVDCFPGTVRERCEILWKELWERTEESGVLAGQIRNLQKYP